MSKDCSVIAIANQKGGVGKTTITECLRIGLADSGKSVFLVDFDSQGDLTVCLSWKNSDEFENTISMILDKVIKDEPIDYSSTIVKHEEGINLLKKYNCIIKLFF